MKMKKYAVYLVQRGKDEPLQDAEGWYDNVDDALEATYGRPNLDAALDRFEKSHGHRKLKDCTWLVVARVGWPPGVPSDKEAA